MSTIKHIINHISQFPWYQDNVCTLGECGVGNTAAYDGSFGANMWIKITQNEEGTYIFTGITKEMPLPIIEKIFLISSVMIKEGKMINDDLVAIGLLLWETLYLI